MNYQFHSGAAQDLADALGFYKQEASSLVASRFLDEFERVAALLVEHPGFGTPIDDHRRIYPLRTFPYSVIYKQTGDGIRVLVVRHQHRAPGYGRSRS